VTFFLSLLSLYHYFNLLLLLYKFMHQSIICLLNCRLSSQFFLYLDCKMRWFPQSTCRFCMLKQLLITVNASLWSFLMACIWTLGCLVAINTGERFSSSLNNMFQRKKKMAHPAITMVNIFLISSEVLLLRALPLHFQETERERERYMCFN
jgi:hypothetical protein